MPLKMTIASAVGVAAVAAAALMAPAMAANSSTQKACPSFTDSHRPGKLITSQLGTKGGFTCAIEVMLMGVYGQLTEDYLANLKGLTTVDILMTSQR